MRDIIKICKKFGFKDVIPYGRNVVKIEGCKDIDNSGKLILVTAMTSNKMGIGKTTISIALADALNKLKQKTILALREPSMGPVFGIKGGATGGGEAQVCPSDLINLHFTGDFHAVAQANNLLASIIDNHIFFGNELDIDTNKIFFKRCLDLNERSLREFSYNIKDKNIISGFNITAASEVMAILCLSKNLCDLKHNLGDILVALNTKGEPVFAKDLNAQEAMAVLLKDAMLPNAVQTKEGNLALIHLGPFANIAHGCNSVIATDIALKRGKFCVTEAGFGSDLGAEKFINIKCRILNKTPNAVVLVVTLDVVKEHGYGDLVAGFENVKKHINNIKIQFKLPLVVAINKHNKDQDAEIFELQKMCQALNVKAVICEGYKKGSKGAMELAKEVVGCSKEKSSVNFTYDLQDSIKTKIEKIAKNIYGAKKVVYSKTAQEKIGLAERMETNDFFVNIAKTQFSFSDNKELVGAPKNFDFYVSDIEIRSGAKMIVAIAGSMLLMPGLGKNSNYLNINLDKNGKINGII